MGTLYREYGSTSSIDIQGIPEQSFFDMLHQFHQERPDQRSLAPAQLGQLLRTPDSPPGTAAASVPSGSSPHPGGGGGGGGGGGEDRGRRKKSGGNESALGTSSLFRKLRSSSRGELDGGKGESGEDAAGRSAADASYKPWVCPKSFVHFDAQSILFDLHEAAVQRGYASQRRNTATGASAASVSLSVSRSSTATAASSEHTYSSIEDLTLGLSHSSTAASLAGLAEPPDGPRGSPIPLLLSCPHFLNETGGHGERNVSFLSSGGERGEGGSGWLRRSNASVSVLEVPIEQQVTRLDTLKLYSVEHVDLGAKYYREYFHGKGERRAITRTNSHTDGHSTLETMTLVPIQFNSIQLYLYSP